MKEVAMLLELGVKEEKVLKAVLESYESELRGEIGKTDIKKFRDALHGEEDVVRDLLNKLTKKAA